MAFLRLHREQADGQLPMVCMRCGDPANIVKTKRLYWFPRWVYLLFLIHPILVVIFALILTRRARIQAPLCERHRWHWLVRQAFVWLTLLGLLILGAGVVFLLISEPQHQ